MALTKLNFGGTQQSLPTNVTDSGGIIDSFTPTTLTGVSSGQQVTLTGNYFTSGDTAKLVKVSDNSETNVNLSISNSTTAVLQTTSIFPAVTTAYKIKYTNNGRDIFYKSGLNIGAPDIVLYNSDDHGGSGDVSSVTGGWTASSYNHNSSGSADATADRIKTLISGTAQTGYGVGYGLRSTNKVTIPTGYNRIEIIYRSVTGYNYFYLSETSLQMGQNTPTSGGHTDGLTNHNPSAGTTTITIDNTIADGTGYYFYFASYGGQYANVNQEITKVRVYAV